MEIFDPTQLKILQSFKIKKKYFFAHRYWDKDIFLAYDVDKEIITGWKSTGFKKSNNLLKFLETKYGGLDKFKIILFDEKDSDEFYEISQKDEVSVYVNFPKFNLYCKSIAKFLNDLKLSKLNSELQTFFGTRTVESFFNKIPSERLKNQINTTHFRIIDKLLIEFDKLPEEEKKIFAEKLEHLDIGTKIIEKYKNLNPEAPEVQLKLFMKVFDKLGEESFSELMRKILSVDNFANFIKEIKKLNVEDQAKLVSNVPLAARLINLHEVLNSSLEEFKIEIKKRKESQKKDEYGIHSFLVKHYWLLGIEYFDKVISTSINEFGKKINETKFYGFDAIPDFTIKMINGDEDECVVIELEAVNDMIFKKNGNLSKEVFDGINQAMTYVILKRVEKKHAVGMAVIGSHRELSEKHREQINLLRDMYPLVEILTYEDIIKNAETIIKFLEKYKNKESEIIDNVE